MNALISHLLRSNLAQIVERSRLNCHAYGLHSIMLLESSGQTIRLFVTDADHVLHRNHPVSYRGNLSIGFHPHHCDLTLHCVAGSLTNWEINEGGGTPITKYRYQSAITTGQGRFTKVADCSVETTAVTELGEGDSLFLSAKQIHTVACPKGEVSAWFVFEGKEDADYQPHCYSPSPLEDEDFWGLYQHATKADVLRLLAAAGLATGGAL